jgi:hypothetical protein
MKRFALGVLAHDKWDFTQQTLKSIAESSQDPASYDLYVIDNGSTPTNKLLLKQWAEINECKNVFLLGNTSIPIAWNLFLSLTSHYPYRTLMDNDVVLRGTLWAKGMTEMDALAAHTETQVIDAGTNPGCPKNVSIVKGVGMFRRAKKQASSTSGPESSFLDNAVGFMSRYSVGMMSYVPVVPSTSFDVMMLSFVKDKYRGLPFLTGGCVTIARPTLDAVGYMDERLTRQVFVDYSQRCLRSGHQIGYHDSYWVMHHHVPPANQQIVEAERRASMHVLDADPKHKRYQGTRWTPIVDAIRNCAETTKIVTLK